MALNKRDKIHEKLVHVAHYKDAGSQTQWPIFDRTEKMKALGPPK